MEESTIVTGSSVHRVTLSGGAAVAATRGTHALHSDANPAASAGSVAHAPEPPPAGSKSTSAGLVEQLQAIQSAPETQADEPWEGPVADAILARMKALKQITERLRTETALLNKPNQRPQDTGSSQ